MSRVISIQTAPVFEPLLQPARYLGAYGGRGSGKSHFFAELLIERCIMVQPTSWACIREVQKSLKQSVKRLVENKIRDLGVSDMFIIKDKEIVTPGGGVIIFEGMQNHTADSIKSLEGFDGAWVEEAQSLSQRSLDLLRPTIRKPGSQLWFGWNPDKETDPVDLLLRGETPPPNSVVIPVNYTDNPWFPKELQDEMEYDKRRDPGKYAWVWLGQYRKISDALVFKNWSIEECEPGQDTILRYGGDWGFSIDPAVLVRCWTEGRKLFIDYEAWEIGCEIVDLPALFLTVPESEKWPMTADSARPETISHMRKNGFPKIYAAVKGPRSLEEGVEWLQSFDIVVHPRCKHVIDELSCYSYKVDPKTEKVVPILADKNNHTIDAIRYACEGARRAAKKTAPKPAAPPPKDWMSV